MDLNSVFVDVDPTTLSMSTDEVIKKINKKTLAVFITHAQGLMVLLINCYKN